MFFDRSRIVTIESDVERIWIAAKLFDAQKKLRADPSEETNNQELKFLGVSYYVDHILEGLARDGLEYGDAPPTHLFVCDALDGVFLMRLSEGLLGYIARIDKKDLLENTFVSGLPVLVFPKLLRSGKTYRMTMGDDCLNVFFKDDVLQIQVEELVHSEVSDD